MVEREDSAFNQLTALLLKTRDIDRGCLVGQMVRDRRIMEDPKLAPEVTRGFKWMKRTTEKLLKTGIAEGSISPRLAPLVREKRQERKGRPCALYPVWYLRTVIDVLRSTGMRQNQLLHIRLMDVDLEANAILLCREGSKTYREWRVPVVSFVRERMRILVERAIVQGAERESYLFDAAMFLNPLGEVGPESAIQPVRSFFTRLTKACGFKVSPHRFRHTLATEMMKSPDRNLALVKGLLGHRSVSTTMEYVELDLAITGQALDEELSLYMDVIPAGEVETSHALT